MELIRSFFENQGSGLISLLVYAAIILVFIIGLFKCIIPVIHNRNILQRASVSIRAGDDAKRSWQEDSFLGRGSLCAHWSEYLDNLFFADGVYHNASNVEDYINEDTVIYGPGRSEFADAVPGLLVSVGFLGTLIGLAKGLSGFSMSDSEAVMDSIVTLIPGMRYAFMTSIFGVIGSVSFTMITRAVYGSTNRTLRIFYSSMSRYAGVLSVDPMTQIAIYQQEQTALIRKMVEGVSGSVSESLAESVSESIHQAIEPLNRTMRDFVNVNTKEQARFLDSVMDHFMERMDKTLSGQLSNLSRTLEETADAQSRTVSNLRESMAGSSKMLDDIVEVTRIANDMVRNNTEYLRELTAGQQETREAVAQLQEQTARMNGVIRQMSGYLKDMQDMQAQLTEDMDAFAQQIAQSSAEYGADLVSAAKDFRASGNELRQIQKEFCVSVSDELKSTLDAYQDYVNQFTRRVDYVSAGISGALDRLPVSVDKVSESFTDQMQRLTQVIANARYRIEDIMKR